jgi:putative ABC transport system permease protein
MFRNYFKIAFRSFARHKGYTLLNVLGLAIGIASSLLILEYVYHELSYDAFHEDKARIYRVQYDSFTSTGEKQFSCATAFPGVGPAMKRDFPEVDTFARMYLRYGGGIVQHEDQFFHENDVFQTDASFFEIFDYPLIQGERGKVLTEPNTAVISVETARKYFGDEDPIGKRFKFGNNEEDFYHIVGVAESPENSHLKFTFLLSYVTMYTWDGWGETTMKEVVETNWGWYDFYNYVRLKPGADPEAVNAKFPEFILKHTDGDWGSRFTFKLQPLEDIHLYSDLIQEARVNGNGRSVYVLMFVAFFILVVAWINYINLATARAMNRALEVGIRKVVGARKSSLIRQFLFESLLLNIISAAVAVILLQFAVPLFNVVTGKALTLSLFSNINFWLALMGFFVVGAIVSGLYPAFVLSSYKPIQVLKGKFATSKSGINLRKVLVVMQFVFSMALIAGTIIVYNQLEYMRSQDLGFDVAKTLIVKGPGVISSDSIFTENFNTFKAEVKSLAGVNGFASSSEIPGNLIYWTNGAQRVGDETAPRIILYKVGVDYDYLNTLNYRFVAGRNFSKDFGTDEHAIILNERGVANLGLGTPEEAINKEVRSGGDSLRVIGVVADFHQEGLKQDFRSIGLLLNPGASSYYSVKLEDANVGKITGIVGDKYSALFPGNPYDFFYLDEFFNRQYQEDLRFGQVISFFSLLAILVACLGLVGLSAFAASRRTKEIGIRKVLGSSIQNIFLLLSKEFIVLVLVATLIAVPIIWYGMSQWLEGFAFRISIDWWIYLVAASITFLIAMATVSYQSLKAAYINPADVLKDE